MTVIKTSQSTGKRSMSSQQHTPVAKNPNRNKKVKDLILDLRVQQQQQQQQQNQVVQNQHVQINTDHIQLQQQHQHNQIQQIHHQYQPQQQQIQFQPQVFHQHHQQHQQHSIYEAPSPQFQLSDQTNSYNNNPNGNNSHQQFTHPNQYLINDNSDAYLVSNNSKLITLNRLNNESESSSLHLNPTSLNNHGQLDLLSLQSQSLHLQQQLQQQQAFNNYMLENHSSTNGNDSGVGNSSSNNSSSNNQMNIQNLHHNHNQQQQHHHHQNGLDCAVGNGFISGHDQHGQFDAYGQQQMISLDSGVDVESNNEEYLIFNLLNKIANGTNADKLMDEEHFLNEKVTLNSSEMCNCQVMALLCT